MSSGHSVADDEEEQPGEQPPPEITFSGGVTLRPVEGGVPDGD